MYARLIFLFFVCHFSAFGMSLEEIGEIIENEFNRIQNSNEVYAYEPITKRDRIKIYCKNECSCYADRFVKRLEDMGLDGKIYVLTLTGGALGVEIHHHSNAVVQYDYHRITVFVNRDNQMFVIDPIMFGNAKIKRFSSWFSNIVEGPHLRFQVREI